MKESLNIKVTNADKILFRASSSGYLMTDPQSKSEGEKVGGLSKSTITHLTDVFVSAKYGRNTDVISKYTTKGLMVEEDSLTLYSLYKNQFFKKNEERFNNEWITGCPDMINNVRDIKSSWDIYTFFRVNASSLNKKYFWQLQSYMDLTGDQTSTLAYCLVNTPESLIFDEKRKLQYKMNVIDDANLVFESACQEIDLLMRYDDIPLDEKVIEIEVPRDQKSIEALHAKVEVCRWYMNKFLFKNTLVAV